MFLLKSLTQLSIIHFLTIYIIIIYYNILRMKIKINNKLQHKKFVIKIEYVAFQNIVIIISLKV